MSVMSEETTTLEDTDESFVSISLEVSESCDLCGLDTGERLASSCQLCLRKSTGVPIQIGFNKMPEVLHSGVVAHESCLTKSHQILTQARRSYQHSPLPHRRGTSVPSDFSTLGLRDTVGDKLQWIINYAKNENIRNKQNHLQVHSNPCTRSSSPVIFKQLTEDSLMRRNSENNLKDAGFLELRKSYTRYLYGRSMTKSQSDDNVVCNTGSCPNTIVGSNQEPTTGTTVPYLGNIKGQGLEAQSYLDSKGRSETYKSKDNNNESKPSEGSKPDSQSMSFVAQKEKQERTESRLWSNKERMDKEELDKMSSAEIKKVVVGLENIIKDISAELVELLQERDSLGQEVKVRNLTIQKLVKMKHSHQDTPIKTTGVGNI